MSKLLKIGNYKVKDNIKQFFYDGCHKIYLIEDDDDIKLFLNEKNYTVDDIWWIEDLEEIFTDSCSLRFISTCKLKRIVPQLRKRTKFTYDDHISYNRF